MPAQTVDAGEAVRLIGRAIHLTEEKRKVLLELRASVLHHLHADPNDFPRPMGVPRWTMTHGSNADCPEVQSGKWKRCHGHADA